MKVKVKCWSCGGTKKVAYTTYRIDAGAECGYCDDGIVEAELVDSQNAELRLKWEKAIAEQRAEFCKVLEALDKMMESRVCESSDFLCKQAIKLQISNYQQK